MDVVDDGFCEGFLTAVREHAQRVLVLYGEAGGSTAPDAEARFALRAAFREFDARMAQLSTSTNGVARLLFGQGKRLALSAAEIATVLALLAVELCPLTREVLRQLNSEACADPTTAALRLFASETPWGYVDILTNVAPLVRLRLIERTAHGESALYRQTWRVPPRLLALVAGRRGVDPALSLGYGCEWVRPHPVGIAGMGVLVAPASSMSEVALGLRVGGVTQVVGGHGIGRRALIRQVAFAHNGGQSLLELDCERMTTGALAAQLGALVREALILDAVLVLRNMDRVVSAEGAGQPGIALLALLRQHIPEEMPLFVTSATPLHSESGCVLRTVQLDAPNGATLHALWHRALPESDALAAGFAATFPVAPSFIAQAGAIVQQARQCRADAADVSRPGVPASDAAPSGVSATTGLLADSGETAAREAFGLVRARLRGVLDGQLSRYAQRVEAVRGMSDLVLPHEQLATVRELIARVRHRNCVYEQWGFERKLGSRGLATAALFYGPPGTGKTLAASVIAHELKMDLYQVDLGRVVSKWIGETEKNLGALFDAAEAGHVVLLFDEADSLFGKRTEVKSSNDRYANQETNYLLQRLETFRGVAVLTTNYESGVDEAFRRRIALHVKFEVPDVTEREALWRRLLSGVTAPMAPTIAFERLAKRFEMSGGYIRNAVVRAAFMAADTNQPIADDLLFAAAIAEYAAIGHVISTL